MKHNTSLEDGVLYTTTQLALTWEPTKAQRALRKGFNMDTHLYLHQWIDLATGNIIDQYKAPLDF